MKKLTLKIDGMHCVSCTMNIDGELEDTDGVTNANTSFTSQQTEVEFDPEKINDEKIIQILKKIGYQATPISQ